MDLVLIIFIVLVAIALLIPVVKLINRRAAYLIAKEERFHPGDWLVRVYIITWSAMVLTALILAIRFTGKSDLKSKNPSGTIFMEGGIFR